MADKQNTAAPESATSVEVEQPEAVTGDAVTKALAHVDSIVDKVTKAIKGGPASQPESAAPVGDDQTSTEGETVETEKGAMSFKQMAEKAGLKDDVLKGALANFEKATGMKGDMKFNSTPATAKTQKGSESGESDEGAPEATDVPLTLAGLAEAVQKAAAFTPGRVAQLQQAQEILKLILTGIAPGASPATTTPALMTHPNPNTTAVLTKQASQSSVSKSGESAEEGEQIVEALKSLGDLIKSIGGRLEVVEKARPAGNSSQLDVTHTKDQTVQKSFWNGVL